MEIATRGLRSPRLVFRHAACSPEAAWPENRRRNSPVSTHALPGRIARNPSGAGRAHAALAHRSIATARRGDTIGSAQNDLSRRGVSPIGPDLVANQDHKVARRAVAV